MEEKFLQEVAKYRKKGPKKKRITRVKHKHIFVPIGLDTLRWLSSQANNINSVRCWIDVKCKICGKTKIDFKILDTIQYNDMSKQIEESVEYFANIKKK